MRISRGKMTIRVDVSDQKPHENPQQPGQLFQPAYMDINAWWNDSTQEVDSWPGVEGYRIKKNEEHYQDISRIYGAPIDEPYIAKAVALARQYMAEATNVWSEVRDQFEDS